MATATQELYNEQLRILTEPAATTSSAPAPGSASLINLGGLLAIPATAPVAVSSTPTTTAITLEIIAKKCSLARKACLLILNLLGYKLNIKEILTKEELHLRNFKAEELKKVYNDVLQNLITNLKLVIQKDLSIPNIENKILPKAIETISDEIMRDLETREDYRQITTLADPMPAATASQAPATTTSPVTAAAASATATSSTAAATISAKTTAIIAKLKSTTTSEDPSYVATNLKQAQTELARVDSSITEIKQQLTVITELQQKLTAKLAKTTTAKPQLEAIITELTVRQEALKTKSTAVTATIPPEQLQQFQQFLEWQRMQAASTAAAATTSPAPAAPASANVHSLGTLPSPPSAH